MSKLSFLAAFAVAMVGFVPATQAASAPVPSFHDFETAYEPDQALSAARAAYADAVPNGMTIAEAKALLTTAGAHCRPDRRSTDIVKCFEHEMTMHEDSISNITWKTSLHVSGDQVDTIVVDRNSSETILGD